jgi:hypothetical protein
MLPTRENLEEPDTMVIAEFGDDRAFAYFVNVSLSKRLTRSMLVLFPALAVAFSGSYRFGLLLAVLGAVVVGSSRLPANARKVSVTGRGLEVVGLDATHFTVSWDDVTALECWRSLGRPTELSVHVSAKEEMNVVMLSSFESTRAVQCFLDSCAARTPFHERRIGPLASLRDPRIRLPLVRELVGIALVGTIAALAGGLYAHAQGVYVILCSPLVGLASAGISGALVVLRRYRAKRSVFVWSASTWSEQRSGSSTASATLPRSLRPWAKAILIHHPDTPKPYR